MSTYPSGIYSPRAKENKNGVVYDVNKKTVLFAEDFTNDDNEIVAIETELGVNPKSDHADVAARLAYIEATMLSRTPRATIIESSATPTPDSDVCDVYVITALAVAAEFGAPTGSPGSGQFLRVRIKGDGSTHNLTWNSAYIGTQGVALPSSVLDGKTEYLLFMYDGIAEKWVLLLCQYAL